MPSASLEEIANALLQELYACDPLESIVRAQAMMVAATGVLTRFGGHEIVAAQLRADADLVASFAERPGPAPVAIKRAIEAALRGAGDPRWGSTIGRLRLEGVIVDRQLGAAESYGRLRGKFDRAMGMPRRAVASVFYEAGRGRAAQEMTEAAIIALRTEHARLLAEIGPLRAVLDRVVLFDDAPLPGELPRLKAGLEMLVGWFRVGEG
ncbi:MAG: hypothetical protein M1826_003318 [Phylliscum demangeonii]|nr:MAG: hypothetical protein M1826_003318 [Phylliscum demangeonii]